MTTPEHPVVQRNLSAVEALRMAKEIGGFARPRFSQGWKNYGIRWNDAGAEGWFQTVKMLNGSEYDRECSAISTNANIADHILEPWEWHPNSDTL